MVAGWPLGLSGVLSARVNVGDIATADAIFRFEVSGFAPGPQD